MRGDRFCRPRAVFSTRHPLMVQVLESLHMLLGDVLALLYCRAE